MGRLNFGGALGGALEAGLTTYKTLKDVQAQDERIELDKRNQALREQEASENSQIRQLTLKKANREDEDAEVSREVLSAMQSGNFDSLSPAAAKNINDSLKKQGIDPVVAFERGKAAETLGMAIPRVRSLLQQQQGNQQNGYDQATGAPVSEARIHQQQVPQYISLKQADPDSFSYLGGPTAKVLFGPERFKTKEPHKYTLPDGREVYGVVDSINPVADILFDTATGKMTTSLNIRAQKKEGDRWVDDPTVTIPPGAPTVNQTNKPDDPIRFATLDELEQHVNNLKTSSKVVLEAQRKAAQAELVKRSPVMREAYTKGLSEDMVNDVKYRRIEEQSPELFKGRYGTKLKEIVGFYKSAGVGADKAVAEVFKAKTEFEKLEKEEAQGKQAIGLVGIMLRSKPEQFGALFAQHSESISPAAMTKAVDSYTKIRGVENSEEKTKLYGLIAQASMIRAQKAGSGGENARDIGNRDQLVSLDKELSNLNAEKRAVLRERGIDDEARQNKAAALQRIDDAIKEVQNSKAALFGNGKQQPQAPSDNVTMQGLTGGGASNNYGYGPAGGARQPQTKVTPPKGFKNTGRTSGGKPVYTDGKRYWTP